MNQTALQVAWLDELAEAARKNLDETPGRLIGEVEDIFARIPYKFLGEDHPIVSAKEAQRRGWAACGDAAAAFAAAAYAYPFSRQHSHLCVEAPESLRGYSHVRVLALGRAFDPYARYRADVPSSCEWTVPVADLIERGRVLIRRTTRIG